MAAPDRRLVNGGLALAGAIALASEGLVRREADPAFVTILLAAATCVPLLWRERAPIAVLSAVIAGLVACLFVFHPYYSATAVAMIPTYTVAIFGDRRRSLIVGAGLAMVLVLLVWRLEENSVLAEGSTRLLLVLGALVIGDLVRTRRELRAAARERAERQARAQEEQSLRRVAAERVRIARELHDTIAHALVGINVRAGVAAHLGQPADNADALLEIKGVSARALQDLRSTLDVLREPETPVPTLAALDLTALSQLVDGARAAGLHTETDLALNGASIPSAVGQAGFRIVQESLTNVMRHARASKTTVRIATAEGALRIEVSDDGVGRPNGTPARDGHGLRGMVERATALGGSVSAGPAPGAGWRVRAILPLSGPR